MRRNLTGQAFGYLVALEDAGRSDNGSRVWKCQCVCGKYVEIRAGSLTYGTTKSCGCMKGKLKVASSDKHHGHAGKSRSYTYNTWRAMRARCLEINHAKYPQYGGKGIKICERWEKFSNFLEDMGERPLGKTLDRLDGNGNYEPSNCRWATPTEQNANRLKEPPISNEFDSLSR